MSDSSILGIDSGTINRFVVVRIKKNQDLLAGIEEIVLRENIKKGIFISIVGALQKGVFRNMKQLPIKLPVQDIDRFVYEIN
nr:DUF296 domain-containing protein [Atribacterota bacterium]